jgi:hypothetical protein
VGRVLRASSKSTPSCTGTLLLHSTTTQPPSAKCPSRPTGTPRHTQAAANCAAQALLSSSANNPVTWLDMAPGLGAAELLPTIMPCHGHCKQGNCGRHCRVRRGVRGCNKRACPLPLGLRDLPHLLDGNGDVVLSYVLLEPAAGAEGAAEQETSACD